MMLLKDPKERITCEEALSHPWITENLSSGGTVHETVLSDSLSRLRGFDAKIKMQQSVSTYISTQLLEEEDIIDLRNAFMQLDGNGDGRLTRKELLEGYNQIMTAQLTEEELDRIF